MSPETIENQPVSDTILLAQRCLRLEAQAIEGLAGQIGDSFLKSVELIANCTGHVIVSGVGTTGIIAHRFAHLLCNVGCPALFLHAGDSLHGSSGAVRPQDLLVLISKTGETRETRELARIVVERKGRIIGITANPESTLAKLSTVVMLVNTPPELDPYNGLMGVGSSLATAALCDALIFAVLDYKGTSQEWFLRGHPGGVVEHITPP
jgi:arabinose-5-phosphate isomerase